MKTGLMHAPKTILVHNRSTLGMATQFPESQLYPNPIVNIKFYHRIPI